MQKQWIEIKSIISTPAFIVISMIAVAFGSWFATNQVNAVVPGGVATYPKLFYFITIFKCYLTVLACYGLANIIFAGLSAYKITPFAVAISFIPLLLVYSSCPMYWILAMVIFLQGILVLTVLSRNDYQHLAQKYSVDTLVFILFFTLHFYLTSRYSPLHWDMAILTPDGYYTDESLVISPMFRGYVLAKQFAFSFFDHAQWGGMLHTPFLLNSPLMQLIAFAFDLPSASYEGFHQVLMTLFFILMVIGSFGFYLFLKYAAKVHIMFAVWGGILFGFSGSPVTDVIMGDDSGVFYPPYAVFPYALLFISLAFEKNNKIYALWAAVALATQLFIFAPHPEGLLYSSVFSFVYTIGLVIFTRSSTWRDKRSLLLLTGTIFLALTAFDVVPILFDRLTGNMYVLGHLGDIKTVAVLRTQPYMNIVYVALPVSFLLRLWSRQLSPVYLSTAFLTVFMLVILLKCNQASFMNYMVKVLHFGIHFTYYCRFSIYFCMLTFANVIFAINGITNLCYQWTITKYPRLAGSVPA